MLVVMTGLARADIARWHAAARKLAHDGNCAQVEVIGNGVRVEDARYYAEQFVVDPSLAPCFAPPPPPPDSYREALIVTDVFAIAGATAVDLFAATTNDDRLTTAAMIISFAAFVAAGPVAHLVHGNRRGALTSAGLRLGLPLGGALIGGIVTAGQGEANLGNIVGAVFGGSLGVLAAYGLDWGLLPYVDHTSTATTVGVAMRF